MTKLTSFQMMMQAKSWDIIKTYDNYECLPRKDIYILYMFQLYFNFFSTKRLLLIPQNNLQAINPGLPFSFHYDRLLGFLTTTRKNWGIRTSKFLDSKSQANCGRKKRTVPRPGLSSRLTVGRRKESGALCILGVPSIEICWCWESKEAFQISTPQERKARKKNPA